MTGYHSEGQSRLILSAFCLTAHRRANQALQGAKPLGRFSHTNTSPRPTSHSVRPGIALPWDGMAHPHLDFPFIAKKQKGKPIPIFDNKQGNRNG